MNLKRLAILELKNFFGARTVVVALALLVVAGLYGVYQGQSVIAKQRAVIAQLPAIDRAHREHEIALNPDDLGNLLYSLQFPAVDEPSTWASFAIGQRDVNPYILRTRLLTLEGQLYESDLANPVNLLYGNFDPAFVIVFLFPLAIIAFCFNIVAEDQESGLWNLLRAQPFATGKLVAMRFLVRFGIVLCAAIALIGASSIIAGGTPDRRLPYAVLITLAYLLFWFAVSALVVSIGRTSAFNALTLLGLWIVLAVVGPALANLLISTALPVSESFEVTVAQREGYHRKWDQPKAAAMEPFFAQYPQFRDAKIPEDKFSWGWYYAMQNAGDVEAESARNGYAKKLARRNDAVETAAVLMPTVQTQLAFNSLAGTDLRTHLDFLDSVRDSHRQTREYFYPLIFRGATTGEVRWDEVPRHSLTKSAARFPVGALTVLATAIALLVGARTMFGRRLG